MLRQTSPEVSKLLHRSIARQGLLEILFGMNVDHYR
jgi:hypothetical protein